MNLKIIGIFALVVVAGGALYWGISPLFRNIKADDALPGATSSESSVAPAGSAAQDNGIGDASAAPAGAEVTGTAGHPASGTARIVEADGKQYVRYENFKTINGPDIFVYLAKNKDAKEFINLGVVKATEGNINYEIPAGTDVSQYPYVLTWCRTFGVLFNYAKVR